MLVYCPTCENPCSEKADACPQCGHPLAASIVASPAPVMSAKEAESLRLIPAYSLWDRIRFWPDRTPVISASQSLVAGVGCPRCGSYMVRTYHSSPFHAWLCLLIGVGICLTIGLVTCGFGFLLGLPFIVAGLVITDRQRVCRDCAWKWE